MTDNTDGLGEPETNKAASPNQYDDQQSLEDSDQSPGRVVIEVYRENKDDMTDLEIQELFARLQDEKNRRRSRERHSEGE